MQLLDKNTFSFLMVPFLLILLKSVFRLNISFVQYLQKIFNVRFLIKFIFSNENINK